MLGVLGATSIGTSRLFISDLQSDIQLDGILFVLTLAGIGLYAFSWHLSIVFFNKREI